MTQHVHGISCLCHVRMVCCIIMNDLQLHDNHSFCTMSACAYMPHEACMDEVQGCPHAVWNTSVALPPTLHLLGNSTPQPLTVSPVPLVCQQLPQHIPRVVADVHAARRQPMRHRCRHQRIHKAYEDQCLWALLLPRLLPKADLTAYTQVICSTTQPSLTCIPCATNAPAPAPAQTACSG